MDIADLERLVKLMAEHDLVEVEIEEEGRTIKLRRGGGYVPVPAAPPALAASASAAPAAPATAANAAPAGPPAGTVEIRSPIVGTFYKSASPEAPPFVQVGDRVGPDTVVCIIEAMKVMNEIKAETAGEVVEVLVDNGEAVEFDEPLFRVKP
jgi:acetyl-CoA carboxylase biotin carboxyl carrier protein